MNSDGFPFIFSVKLVGKSYKLADSADRRTKLIYLRLWVSDFLYFFMLRNSTLVLKTLNNNFLLLETKTNKKKGF